MYNSLLIGLALASAQADNVYQQGLESSVIDMSDLDLTTSAGKARLGRRIQDACGDVSNIDLAGMQAARNCRDQAEAQAMYVVNSRLSKRIDVQLAVR